MKHMKKIMSLLLTLVMVLAMGVNVWAATGTYKITINPNPDDKTTHTYEAYQIFSGTVVKQGDKEILSDIKWGDGVKGGDLLAKLKGSTKLGTPNPFKDIVYTGTADDTSAEDVARILKGFNDDAGEAQEFADLAAECLTNKTSGSYGEIEGTTNKGITGLTAGYYLVKDAGFTGTDGAYSRFILKVAGDVVANAKSEVPTVDKNIIKTEGKEAADGQPAVAEELVKANTASIGDKIPYKVTSKVPDMTGYDKYFFVLHDTMTKGLTFNNDVAVTIDGTPVTDFTVTTEDKTEGEEPNKKVVGTKIKIVLNNFIYYKDKKDKDIVVTYSATLNSDADRTQTGNVNDVKLQYSNNPNYDYQGENEPSGNDPTGETPESTVKTYTTGIELTKVDGADETVKLEGAEFALTGTSVNTVLVSKEVFEEAEEGTTGEYYLLKDGTYTKIAPDENNSDKYDPAAAGKTYNKVKVVEKQTKTNDVNVKGTTNSEGILTFDGLTAGEYTITELKAPDGYNLLKKPIKVTIGVKNDSDGKPMISLNGCTWEATVKNGDDTLTSTIADNRIKFTVQNNSGSTLPSTGGIGTTIFTVVGIALMACAAVLLVTRRRMYVAGNR